MVCFVPYFAQLSILPYKLNSVVEKSGRRNQRFAVRRQRLARIFHHLGALNSTNNPTLPGLLESATQSNRRRSANLLRQGEEQLRSFPTGSEPSVAMKTIRSARSALRSAALKPNEFTASGRAFAYPTGLPGVHRSQEVHDGDSAFFLQVNVPTPAGFSSRRPPHLP